MTIGFGGQSWAAKAEYPVRPIQIVIGYSPGSTDMGLKLLVDKLPEFLGQPVVFVYKPGAAGSMGASYVAKSKPDGYTLLGTTQGSVVLAPETKELDYTLDDFESVIRFSQTPVGLAVQDSSPWHNVKDMVEAAKKAPGKFNYSTSGVWGSTHFIVEVFEKMAGINLTHVPTAGSAPAVTALLGGHVTMAGSSMGPLMPHLNSGALRILGFFQKERPIALPNCPTFAEQGYPANHPAWYGLLGPKGMPREVVEKINLAAKKAVEKYRSSFEENLKRMGFELLLMDQEEMTKECREEREMVKKVFKELGGVREK
jgi:tripartite-type tricarboxylate transporter receptor subunit TctC